MAKRGSKEWKEKISRSVRAARVTLSESAKAKQREGAAKGRANRVVVEKPLHELSGWPNIRRRVFKARGRRCQKCGWDERRSDGQAVTQVHHKDGDRKNNHEDNLEVLCPNCHALTDHFMNYNRKNE